MSAKKIVVVGAGFAGVYATKHLSKKLKKEDVEITLIDKHSYHTMMTELHEVAGNRVAPQAVQHDLRRLFHRRKNVKLVTDKVTGVDQTKKVVQTTHGEYPFDYLILGMGSEPNDFGTPGVKEHGLTLWSMEDAIKVKEHILKVVRTASVELDDAKRKALLTFVVCGGGFTGVELMGELVEWKKRLAKDYKLPEDEFTLILVEALPKILTSLTEKDADKVVQHLEKKKVKVQLNEKITNVEADHIMLNETEQMATYTLIWTAGVKANSDADHFGFQEARGNRLEANDEMLAKGFEDQEIYIVGDQVYYEENGKPTPQIVQAAEQTAHTASENIIADIKKEPKKTFKSNYQGFMVSVGSKWGVAYLFDKYHLSNFWAILMKHLVNLKYFFDIGSGYYMFQYIMHEFFRIKDDRTVFRGHTSRYGNVLWSVPLRMFYGVVWLVDAMKKIIGEGKWTSPGTWFGKGSWFDPNKMPFPFEWLQPKVTTGASASEATSAASGAATTASKTAETVFGLNYTYGEEPKLVFEHMPHWFESIMKFLLPNAEVAHFMAKLMTFFELAIALALIVGLFTWLASAVTIPLVVMFCLSGMYYWVNIWFLFVAFALMNGAGRAVGLDKWVIPWIQRKLGNWWYGRPQSIYRDER